MTQPLDISIGQRLAISFGLLLLVLTLFIGFMVERQTRSARAESALAERIIPLNEQANVLKRDIYHVAIHLRAYLRLPSTARLQRYRDSVEETRTSLRRLRAQPKEADGDALYESLEPAVTDYLTQANGIVNLRAAQTIAIADEESLAERRTVALAAVRELIELYGAKLEAGLAAVASARQDVFNGMMAASVLLVLLFVVIGHFTARSIRRPARELLHVAGALEVGDWRPALRLAPAANGGGANRAPRGEMARLGCAFAAAAVALESREQRMAADGQVAAAAASSLEREKIADLALTGIVKYVRAEVGVVYWREPDADVLQPIAWHAIGAHTGPVGMGEGLPGQAARERQIVVVQDVPRDSGFAVRLGYDQAPPKAVAAVPIVFGKEVCGVVLVASLRNFDDAALAFLRAAGVQLGIGFRNVRAHTETERLLAEVRDRNERIQTQNEELQAQNEEIQAQSEEIQAQSEEIQAQSEEIQAQNDELKQHADDLRQHTRALAEAGERKSEFLGVLAHELRNPLAAITNSLVIAKRTPPGSEQSLRAQAVIERQAQQLVRLIDDLLDITRISQRKIQIQRDRLDLVEIVRSCAEDQEAELEANGLAVALELPPSRVWVEGDQARLCQIIGNLLNNAIKFTDKGNEIVLALRPQPESRQVALHVIDTGIGIDAGLLPKLFQSFNQGVVEPGRTNTGLGLGLALVKELTELHGGSVEARSDGPGKGAEFIVRLPLADRGEQSEPERSRPGAEVCRRILVIEDNADVAHTLRDVLTLDGHDVQLAHSGAQALQLAPVFRPDVVLCDIGLPEMDGYEVARKLRADERVPPAFLVALTGYASAIDKERAAKAGFDRHLAKPPSIESIKEILASIATP